VSDADAMASMHITSFFQKPMPWQACTACRFSSTSFFQKTDAMASMHNTSFFYKTQPVPVFPEDAIAADAEEQVNSAVATCEDTAR
jgi:hypothetical protein